MKTQMLHARFDPVTVMTTYMYIYMYYGDLHQLFAAVEDVFHVLQIASAVTTKLQQLRERQARVEELTCLLNQLKAQSGLYRYSVQCSLMGATTLSVLLTVCPLFCRERERVASS